MKRIKWLIYIVPSLLFTHCIQEEGWTDNYDIELPVPSVTGISATKVYPNDTIDLIGYFPELTSVTIGGKGATINWLSPENTQAKIIVTEACISGPLVLQNVYKKKYTYPQDIVVIGGGQNISGMEVAILDFSDGKLSPLWTPNTWTEAKELESRGYDLNKLTPPAGYEHYYTMNDSTLYPPDQPSGQSGNIPYGNLTYDNEGNGFDLSLFTDPYVSVLINTGNHIAYMSLIINDEIYDLEPAHSPGGTFANSEKRRYMQTDNKWLWYTFSLKEIMGTTIPSPLTNAGLFIRNSWDYGAEEYPGFQLNIVKMVITEGALPTKIILFDFEEMEPEITTEVTYWASDMMASYGRNLTALTAPDGNYYYSFVNHHSGDAKNYKLAIKNDNGGAGFNFSKMKEPYLTFAINTGNRSGFIDFVFYQRASGNSEGEPWADPGANNSALEIYPEALAKPGVQGYYYDTQGKWEWRTYNLVKLLNGVESWGLQGGAYPDFTSVFDYVLIWPRDGWNNTTAAAPYEVNIDYVIVTDGLPTGLPDLNDK